MIAMQADWENRLARLERVVLGDDYMTGLVENLDDHKRLVSKMHDDNIKRLRRIQLIMAFLLGGFVVYGSISGWKLSVIETAVKAAVIVAK